jgi:hypothetical protein
MHRRVGKANRKATVPASLWRVACAVKQAPGKGKIVESVPCLSLLRKKRKSVVKGV